MKLCLDQTITREDTGHLGIRGGHVETVSTASMFRTAMACWRVRWQSQGMSSEPAESWARDKCPVFCFLSRMGTGWGTDGTCSKRGQSDVPEDYTATHPVHVFIFIPSTSSITSLIDYYELNPLRFANKWAQGETDILSQVVESGLSRLSSFISSLILFPFCLFFPPLFPARQVWSGECVLLQSQPSWLQHHRHSGGWWLRSCRAGRGALHCDSNVFNNCLTGCEG